MKIIYGVKKPKSMNWRQILKNSRFEICLKQKNNKR